MLGRWPFSPDGLPGAGRAGGGEGDGAPGHGQSRTTGAKRHDFPGSRRGKPLRRTRAVFFYRRLKDCSGADVYIWARTQNLFLI